MGNTNTKETVFKSGWFKRPTYRIPALLFHENNFLAFCEKRLNGTKDYGPMNMVLRRGCLSDEGINWEPEVKLYPENDSKDTDKKRPMNPVPIDVGKNHIILMFNTYPENTPSSVMQQSNTRLWQIRIKHSYDGGKTWSISQQLPVDHIFSDSKKRPIPSYCAVGPGHSIKLESGRLVVTGNIAWPKSVGESKRFNGWN
ncbi:sialidase-3-like [Anneissia japonica]|uniref:sialidase-3-like n=1 Tax=Anneissia japonica TaxID=1529436 RepID=UPI001425AFA9|nr:sialidase-3-like [Anneissia japonica]